MATKEMIRHGTRAGYKAEKAIGEACQRCMAANRVFQRQYTKIGKQKGLKYSTHDVIDHLDHAQTQTRLTPSQNSARAARSLTDHETVPPASQPPTDQLSPEPTLGDRLSDRIRGLIIGGDPNDPEYVEEDTTGYVHEIEDTDSPGPEWEAAEPTEYIINAAGIKQIEENMATYLSVIGITVEMIDPYCGPILAQNFDNMVKRWSKVVAHYPKAADLFLDAKGGVIFTWIGALQATWPVLYALYQHHLAKTVAVAPNGQIYFKNQRPNPENNGQVDSLQPDFQYSAT